MMADGQVSVGASLTYGVQLWLRSWRAIWGVLALQSLAATIYVAGVYALNNDLLAAGVVAQLITQPMLYGAVFRIALADRHTGDADFTPGHAGLQWRAAEWRLLACTALLGVFFAVVGLLALFVVGSLALALIMSHGGAAPPSTPQAAFAALGQVGQTVVLIVSALTIAGLVYLYIRMSLAFAATADRGKIMVMQSWPTTRGQFWRIFLAMIVLQLPLTVVQSLVTGLASDGRVAATAGMPPGPAMVSALILGVIAGAAVSPIAAGVLAYFYRSLVPVAPGGAPGSRP